MEGHSMSSTAEIEAVVARLKARQAEHGKFPLPEPVAEAKPAPKEAEKSVKAETFVITPEMRREAEVREQTLRHQLPDF